MNILKLIEACQIFSKYVPADADRSTLDCFQAEHDEIYIGDETWPITEEDRNRLEELGFTNSEPGMGFHAFT